MAGQIPVVKFCSENLKISGTRNWALTREKVREALEEYGCFVALYDSVSMELSSNMFDSLKELFDVPLDRKLQNVSEKPYHGYFGQNPLMPIHESMGIEDPILLTKTQSFTNLMWPSNGNKLFCENVNSYAKQVSQLDQTVKNMVFESYGVRNHLDSHVKSTRYLLRMIKYRVPQQNEMNLGAFPHTDKSFLTILHQNQVNGLQIKTKDNKWLEYEPSSSSPSTSSFIVMAGDAFFAWSNGRIYSPPHRVMMSKKRERYSMGLFSFNDGIVQIPKELVDENHPQQFKPFDHQDYLRFYSTERGQNSPCAIKAYCGVGNGLVDTRGCILLH